MYSFVKGGKTIKLAPLTLSQVYEDQLKLKSGVTHKRKCVSENEQKRKSEKEIEQKRKSESENDDTNPRLSISGKAKVGNSVDLRKSKPVVLTIRCWFGCYSKRSHSDKRSSFRSREPSEIFLFLFFF